MNQIHIEMCIKTFFLQMLLMLNYPVIFSQEDICSKDALFEYSQESCSKTNAIFNFEIKQKTKKKGKHLNGFAQFEFNVRA